MDLKKLTYTDYFYVGIQLLLFAAYLIPVSLISVSIPSILSYTGLIIAVAGLVLGLIALVQINTNLSPFPRPVSNSNLLISGSYKLSRHPIYTSILMISFGYSLFVVSLYKVFISVLLLILFYMKSKYEERLLEKEFSEYRMYKEKTRRFL